MIKTIYAGDRLQAALARQRQWFAQHGVEEAASAQAVEVRPGLVVAAASTSVWGDAAAKRRMAKAGLRATR